MATINGYRSFEDLNNSVSYKLCSYYQLQYEEIIFFGQFNQNTNLKGKC